LEIGKRVHRLVMVIDRHGHAHSTEGHNYRFTPIDRLIILTTQFVRDAQDIACFSEVDYN